MPDPPQPPRGFQPGPFDYHQEIELDIHTLTNQGQGLGRIDNWVVLVPFALPGETVRARVFRNHPNYSDADLLEILRPSPHRVEPRCPLFTQCGGCQYQNLAYEEQLAWKKRQVRELLQRLAGLDHEVEDVVPSPRTYSYRSKLTPHFRKPKKGAIDAIGFLRAGQRSRLVDVPQCPIAAPALNDALAGLRRSVRDNAASYKKGATLLLRQSTDGVLTEPREIAHEKVGAIDFEFLAGEFFQNNSSILPGFTAYAAGEAAAPAPDGNIRFLIDAYCGSGLFTLTAAASFEEVLGIEISEAAIGWARHNAAQNRVANASFIEGRAEDIFAGVSFPPGQTAVLIDPPRKGCDRAFIRQLLAFRPARIVYVSCNPATQMRDLALFAEPPPSPDPENAAGTAAAPYRLARVQPFDLFPQTKHLECVITLERR